MITDPPANGYKKLGLFLRREELAMIAQLVVERPSDVQAKQRARLWIFPEQRPQLAARPVIPMGILTKKNQKPAAGFINSEPNLNRVFLIRLKIVSSIRR